MFLDEVRFKVIAGNGGPGCVSFRRAIFVPKGGPDGGNGGKGGDVIFEVKRDMNSLHALKFQREYSAGNGRPGEGDNKSGRDGEDLVLQVPPGTVVRDHKNGELIFEFDGSVDRWTLLRGGKGGRGNDHFKTSTNRTPRNSEPGIEGQRLDLDLTLKLIADVGLVGFPNAGKSSLLARVSAARPAVADYPFTTLTPHLGVHVFGGQHQVVFADIPGLIEGASEGRGLGHKFLRHIERTRMILHLVEPYDPAGVSPVERVRLIREELRRHSQALAEKPQLLVLNKCDTNPTDVEITQWERELGASSICISAVTGQGIGALLKAVQQQLSL